MTPFPDPDDEQLRSLFQQAAPPLRDDGFTSRVTVRLAASRPLPLPLSLWATVGAFVGLAIASAAIALSVGSDGAAPDVAAPLRDVLGQPAFGLGLLVSTLSLASAWLILRQPGTGIPWRHRVR